MCKCINTMKVDKIWFYPDINLLDFKFTDFMTVHKICAAWFSCQIIFIFQVLLKYIYSQKIKIWYAWEYLKDTYHFLPKMFWVALLELAS